jgi:ubiquinone/menaquinone biosynthesis C-methylase UbiE
MAQPTSRRPRVLALGILATVGAVTIAAQGTVFPTAKLFDALALKPGATACEMGAGDGELSLEAASRVGAEGRVYANEVGDNVQKLRDRIAAAKRSQIAVVTGAAERTNFPDGACDVVFMRKVYHHFDTPAAMNLSIAAALKPGGRLAIVDFGPPPGAEAANPADRDADGHHGITASTVARELRAAGFDGITTETGPDRTFMVVARKTAR